MENVQTAARRARNLPAQRQTGVIRSEDGLAVSEAVYWEKYYEYCGASDFNYEWKNGYLEEKPESDYRSDVMIQWFIRMLQRFLEAHQIGKLITLDIGFRVALPGETSIRKPDYADVLHTNPVELRSDDRSFSGIYDLCIELFSDATTKDIRRDTVEKKREYAAAGVQEYYILDARDNETAFYRRHQPGGYDVIVPQHGEIMRSSVLPGFQFRVSDLYRQPPLEDMAEDPVYSGFVLPYYQAERQRAQQERQRAERLAAQLRSLGISPD